MADSPVPTVSTRWLSLRKAISSIEQVSRRSSQTSRLAMRHLPGSDGARKRLCGFRFGGLALHFQDELRALSRRGAHRDAGVVCLHDLINDGKTEAGAFFEL